MPAVKSRLPCLGLELEIDWVWIMVQGSVGGRPISVPMHCALKIVI